jgi:D123
MNISSMHIFASIFPTFYPRQAQAARLMEPDSDDENALDEFDTDGNETEVRSTKIIQLNRVFSILMIVKKEQSNAPSFPEVEDTIRDAVAEYEGAVFPKLNWSSPRVWCVYVAMSIVVCITKYNILGRSLDYSNANFEMHQCIRHLLAIEIF